MLILGIETSFDETCVSLYDTHKGLINNIQYSQKIHNYYGGVVPELASRYHILKLKKLIKKLFLTSFVNFNDLNYIAYTAGPGLIGSLMIGATVGKSLAYTLKIPSIAINHIEGHLLSPMIGKKQPKFPFIALVVSGGHTQLILAKGIGLYKILGDCIDDSAGEAFDKIAKLLGLNYPGGKMLENLAKLGQYGNYFFPRPMLKKPGLSFSFSGLKTHVAKIINKKYCNEQSKADIALAFENAVIDTLVLKSQRALNITGYNKLIISGGVSSNKLLRHKMKKMVKKINCKLMYAKKEFCTDNAVMIAYASIFRINFNYNHNLSISVKPKWSIEDTNINKHFKKIQINYI
ncbi:MAG: tRNA (adenosine(37)-N6)-threonylcarbamoyltransferase complex transferase subunit TsaD [Candidatus Makana argininalis]